jgi:type IV pilus assembly protein PilM
MAYRKRVLPIGIHMNADAVYMAQLEQGDGGLSLVSKASQRFSVAVDTGKRSKKDMPEELAPQFDDSRYDEARDFVREKVASDGFRSKTAVLSLPAESLVIQHVRVPPVSVEELPDILPTELQGKLPFDPRKAVLRNIVAGQVSENGETKQDVIVMAVRREVIERYVAAASRLGLQVVGLGVEPCCMGYPYAFEASRAVATNDGPAALMVVHLGQRTTHVGILRGQDTVFVKGVELGTDQLIEALATARNIPANEVTALREKWRNSTGGETLQDAIAAYNTIQWNLGHIIDEIQSCMRYYMSLGRGARIDRVVFVGSEAKDRALVRVLGAHLNVSCVTGDPFEAVTGSPSSAVEPEMAVAVGLSLFGAQ